MVLAILLYGFGGLMVAMGLLAILSNGLLLVLQHRVFPLAVNLAMLGVLVGGAMWVASGTAFRSHRSLRGVILGILGYAVMVGSGMLMGEVMQQPDGGCRRLRPEASEERFVRRTMGSERR